MKTVYLRSLVLFIIRDLRFENFYQIGLCVIFIKSDSWVAERTSSLKNPVPLILRSSLLEQTEKEEEDLRGEPATQVHLG